MPSQTSVHKSFASDGPCQVLNPLDVREWDELIQGLPDYNFFHGTAWLRVLQEAYGYVPLCFAEMVGKQLASLLPIMEVRSRITGTRGVALPFADFCPPLAANAESGQELLRTALDFGKSRSWKYLEWRGLPLFTDHESRLTNHESPSSRIHSSNNEPRTKNQEPTPSLCFKTHILDLSNNEPALLSNLDASTRRSLRKAEKSGLDVEISTSPSAMEIFHQLYCLTRQRHGLPPQPLKFFKAIHKHVISVNQGFIVTVLRHSIPVASSVFFTFCRKALYKYGASDYTLQELRANNLVMWSAIKRLAADGFESLHLGRTSLANEGLRRFKLGWGARESTLSYFKFNYNQNQYIADHDDTSGWHTHVFRRLPITLSRLIGSLLYPHMA